MDKHEQAQRFAEIFCDKIEKPFFVQTRERMEIIAENAWKLADAMQAEADKRKEKGFPEAVLGGMNKIESSEFDEKYSVGGDVKETFDKKVAEIIAKSF